MNSRRAWPGALAVVLLALALPATAGAAVGSLTYQQDVSGGAGFGPRGVTVSPDGKSVYVAGQEDGTIRAYTRGTTGLLSAANCYTDTTAPVVGCTQTDGLDGARFVAVSPDNKHVYVTGGDDDAVVGFTRSNVSGALSNPACIDNTGAGDCDPAAVAGLDGAEGIAVSPGTGSNVYVASQFADSVVTFSRNSSNGALTGATCFGAAAGCTGTSDLNDPRELVVTPDGGGVYVAAGGSDKVKAFKRGAGGVLTDAGSATASVLPVGLGVSPDSKQIYAGLATSAAVRTFTRNTSTSAITPAGCAKDPVSATTGCVLAEGLENVEGVAVSPDTYSVYAAGASDEAVVQLGRGPTGVLAPAACFRVTPGGEGCGSAPGLGGAHGVAVSPDNKNVYVTGQSDDAVVVFKRETAGTPAPPPPFNPTRPNDCTNTERLLALCGDPLGPGAVCNPLAPLLPQCTKPTSLPVICGPSNTLLQACGPGENFVAACGGTGTILPTCPTRENPVIFCGGRGTVLPECNIPATAIRGEVVGETGEINVTVECDPVAAISGKGKTCVIDAAVADYKRAEIQALRSAASSDGRYAISNNITGTDQVSHDAAVTSETAVFVARARKLIDEAFADAERGEAFDYRELDRQLLNRRGPPPYRWSYGREFDRDVFSFTRKVAAAIKRYEAFIKNKRVKNSSAGRSARAETSASGLVKPLAKKRVRIRKGKRKKIRLKLSKKAVRRLRKGIRKRKGVAVRLLVTYRTRKGRRVVRMVDFSVKQKPKKKKRKKRRR